MGQVACWHSQSNTRHQTGACRLPVLGVLTIIPGVQFSSRGTICFFSSISGNTECRCCGSACPRKRLRKALERGCPWPKFMSTARWRWRGVPLPGSDATQWPPFYLFSVLLGHLPAFNDRKSLSSKALQPFQGERRGALSTPRTLLFLPKNLGEKKWGSWVSPPPLWLRSPVHSVPAVS